MKGYRMVLLVNGGIFLFVAVNAFLLAQVLTADADRCAAETSQPETCSQTRDTARTAKRVAPIIAGAGILLLLLGFFLGRRRSAQPLGPTEASEHQRMPDDWNEAVHETPDGLVIDIEVVPNARSPGFPVGFNPWRKRIQARVAAPPQDGRANDELVALVAAALHIPRDRVTLADGHTSRRKRVAVKGIASADFLRLVAEATGER